MRWYGFCGLYFWFVGFVSEKLEVVSIVGGVYGRSCSYYFVFKFFWYVFWCLACGGICWVIERFFMYKIRGGSGESGIVLFRKFLFGLLIIAYFIVRVLKSCGFMGRDLDGSYYFCCFVSFIFCFLCFLVSLCLIFCLVFFCWFGI